MWDQTENYRHNGFTMAFALNLPMANVTAPQGYMADAIDKIPTKPMPAGTSHRGKPDVIVLMSESFWDPTRLPNVKLSPDPMPTIREMQSGNVLFAGIRRDDRQCRVRGADRFFECLPALWQPFPISNISATRSRRSPPSSGAKAMWRAPCIRSRNGSGTAALCTRRSALISSSRKRICRSCRSAASSHRTNR